MLTQRQLREAKCHTAISKSQTATSSRLLLRLSNKGGAIVGLQVRLPQAQRLNVHPSGKSFATVATSAEIGNCSRDVKRTRFSSRLDPGVRTLLGGVEFGRVPRTVRIQHSA